MTYHEYEDGEWELTPKDLATLFMFKGWQYATPSLGYGTPGPESIQTMFRELAAEIQRDGRTDVITSRGRFMAVRSGESAGSIDLYLNVGYLWDGALSEDEEQMLKEMGFYGNDDEEN